MMPMNGKWPRFLIIAVFRARPAAAAIPPLCLRRGKLPERTPATALFLRFLGAGLTFALVAPPASATPDAPAAAPVALAVHPRPEVDPANRLAGRELIRALREGGLVLYLRHTETGVITDECGVSNLSARGEQDAVRVGQALRALKVPIGKVLSSDVCRVRDTARLLDVGEVEIAEDLSNVPKRSGHDFHAGRMRLLATLPPKGTNHLLASHLHGGNSPQQWIDLVYGEMIVFRPDGKGGSNAVARIRAEDWAGLIQIDETRQ